ncbi:DNA polymerase/3'-5' exonuclease PolX [Virgibacillus halophilus]|uniref:DNA-directed DNA polymerase n=1 Tax=Tigheibacillus halophilus TaxID=361280 RepID=A0ABU5CC52_9BACI|nr:DNA polymerase/3'-5' exonuclease PolX [Virgibacillus halophilus]
MEMNKKDIIRLLEQIAVLLELKGENSFKIAAYSRAAQNIERDSRALSEIDDFTKIKGIGKGTSSVIMQYIHDGKSEALEELKKQVPAGLIPLLQVPGLGGKKLSRLYQELNVTDAESLREALVSKEVEALPGFGKKSAEKLLASLQEMGKRPERLPIAVVLPIVEKLNQHLETIPEIRAFSIAGSVRRMRETVKDIDFIIATEQPDIVGNKLLDIENVKEVIAKGQTKVSVILAEQYDINVDFRMVKENEFATTLHHFTGSSEHNVHMRQLAKSHDEKISEYGVENVASQEILQFTDEEQFYAHFNLRYIPPELREDSGEIEAFAERKIAEGLLHLSHIKGDLHMHTTWSDGAQSLEEMAEAARRKGYEYIAITDHSKFLRVANGLDETRLRKQKEEINRLNERYADLHIFSGVEMDILPDGSLDFSDKFLREMDFVIAAIHSSFSQSQEQIMTRLKNAMNNPYVSLIAHPTGRLIGKRDGYAIDMEELIATAAETNTALEINANPNRLDLSAAWAKKAQEKGVVLSIDTDAHNYSMLEDMKYGVATARKGWISKNTVMNTWTAEKIKSFCNHKRMIEK